MANSPVALRFPKQIFLRCTPVRRGSFGTVVGGLDTFLFEKSEQPLIMLEQSPSEIPDLAMGTI